MSFFSLREALNQNICEFGTSQMNCWHIDCFATSFGALLKMDSRQTTRFSRLPASGGVHARIMEDLKVLLQRVLIGRIRSRKTNEYERIAEESSTRH